MLLAAAYYGAAKVGQTLRYTASVSAIWPPAGLGIAALYLWGLRWWPGVLLGELVVNGQLLLDDSSIPVGSLLGQQTGNMAEIIVGALLLRRLIGPDAAMDRVEHVGGMLVALGTATAISATVGTLSMLAGGVVDGSDVAEFWRTWWLGDTSGGLVVLPLMLAWARDPLAAWRRIRTWEGAAVIAAVTALGVVAVSTEEPITYVVFPALIWIAFRFGPPGATLSIAITAAVAIGVTAHDFGPVLAADDRPQDAEHAALHRCRCADHAVPERSGERTRAISPGSRRSSQKRGRAGGGGATPDRSRSARFRLPGPVLDGASHANGAEGSRPAGRPRPRRGVSHNRSARSPS